MTGGKSAATHLITALATLGLAALWFGEIRKSPTNQIPRPGRRGSSRPPPARPCPGRAPSLPDDLLRRVDADEQINIRVYAAVEPERRQHHHRRRGRRVLRRRGRRAARARGS